jgi:nicotinamide mononucleotide (NMN) deamidase PncC
MSELSSDSNVTSIEDIKARIANVSSKPLDEHSAEFEEIHNQMTQALSEIDGL